MPAPRPRTAARRLVLAVTALAVATPLPAGTPRGTAFARILELEDTRTGGSTMEGYLRSGDRGIRRRAALAAGRIGDGGAVPGLLALLGDAEPQVRQMAAFGLGLIGDRAAAERLRLTLQDPEPIVRARAVEALGRLGDAGVAAEIARVAVAWAPAQETPLAIRGDDPGSVTDPWLPLRLALFALVRLKDPAAAESALLVDGKPRFDWWAATWAAMRLEDARLRPVLAAAAASSDPLSRGLAARGLGALKDVSALPLLEPLAADADEFVAVNAIRALGTIGDPSSVDAVARRLRSESDTLVWEALKALAQLPAPRALRADVLPLLGDDRPWIRAAALPVMARLEREDFPLVLSGLDPDSRWWVRAAAAGALGRAGDPASLSALAAMLGDHDARVLPAVMEALRTADAPGVADTLRAHLEHAAPTVRAAAAEGLVAMKAPGISGPLAAAYRATLSDRDPEARLALVDALAAQTDRRATDALREAAGNDPARVVRLRAGAALRARGEAAPEPGSEGLSRPFLDYRRAVTPYDPPAGAGVFSPRVFLHTTRGVIEIHLDVVEAPLTSARFVELARRGFYDELEFHRVIPHFVAQGGDPRGDGAGGPGYTIRDEVTPRPFTRGAVGMALAGKDTGGSQFFITMSPQPHLDGTFTVFGWVANGMDVAERLRPGDTIDRVVVWTGQ